VVVVVVVVVGWGEGRVEGEGRGVKEGREGFEEEELPDNELKGSTTRASGSKVTWRAGNRALIPMNPRKYTFFVGANSEDYEECQFYYYPGE
jgi:hypothetical protein